jgi:ammonium transporter, Amt family
VKRKLLTGAALSGALLVALATPAAAQEAEEIVAAPQVLLDNLWVFIAGILVFLMQAGFALVEAGLTRAKNVGNIMMKNLMDCSAGVLAFFLIGYSIAFGDGELFGGWFGFDGFGVAGIDESTGDGLFTPTFFFFQAAFAATAATIVSGAMAERTRFKSYFVYSVGITAFIYPVILRWTWGGGWLAQREFPFSDFAGSTIVHATGGWAALMGAMILGPRLGKYGADRKPRAIPGHSIPFVVLGAMILFIGWFGFNPGSELAMDEFVSQLAVKTLLAGAAGAVVAMVVNWLLDGKPDVSMAANGLLAGLVSITAPVGAVTTSVSILIGAVGGVIVVFAVRGFDRIGIDDPVGAISVHGVCGAWGTLAAGLFNAGGVTLAIIGTQLIGIAAAFLWAFGTMFVFFKVLHATFGIRVSPEEEIAGLDAFEHGNEAYGPDTFSSSAAGITA